MNYFAHALRHLDRPYFLAGLAVPDWLSVVDRKVRVRRRSIEPRIGEFAGADREIVLGILQHLDDDRWFHGTAGFFGVTGTIGAAFRETLDEAESWRCGFLGHIVAELLLDAELIERNPSQLTEYYAAMDTIDPALVEHVVSDVATRPADRLAEFIHLYRRERFLDDYSDDQRLLRRLNQVMSRVQLNPLPDSVIGVLAYGRATVKAKLDDLLPEAHFGRLPMTGEL